jgi:hypothetical protein
LVQWWPRDVGLVQLQLSTVSPSRELVDTSIAISGGRFAVEFLLVVGVSYALTIGVAAIGGLEDSAGLRGATVLMGPLNILFMGVGIQVLPMMVRQGSSRYDELWRTAKLTSVSLSAGTLIWGCL